MRVGLVAALGAAVMLGGCVGPLVPVAKVEENQAAELQKTVRIYPPDQTPKAARVLGPVTANSCKNKLWDKDPSEEDAKNQLSLYSRSMGGNAVGNFICEPVAGTSLATNCWASITCRGSALLVDDGSQAEAPSARPTIKRRR